MPQKNLGYLMGLLCTGTCLVQGKEFCFGVNNEQYRCEMGYCCGETECCTYYYELWWFWLVWTLIIMLSCCCAYRHRRVKMRLQQEQRQREISLMAYQGASSSFITPPPVNLRFWTDCKLPDYEEVVGHPPTPPPPYSEIPPETTPSILMPATASQSEDSVVLEPLVEAEPASTSSTHEQEIAGAASQSDSPEEEDGEAPLDDEEDELELVTRRRHVTGDSGIEVCVCRLDDVDEDASVCQGAGGNGCCSSEHRHALRHKDHAPSPSPAPSGGDRLV